MALEHLFRHEASRLLATLTRVFGVENLGLAEDVVQETLTAAFATWSYSGVPDHYAGLLMVTAKNKAIDALRRRRTAEVKAADVGRHLERDWAQPNYDALFLPDALKDDELRMMFSCCYPRLDEDVQVALVLSMLCGFSVQEIASAFLLTEAAVEKRLTRGKKTLAESHGLFDLTASDFTPRLSAVHRALYLLFNEGYHAASSASVVRIDLCREAMRLVHLLVDHAPAATSATFALASMMSLHAGRLPSRTDESGNLTALLEQDRSRWDRRLIAEGMELLEQSATGSELTTYHLEAAIAATHATAAKSEDTKWAEIVELYDALTKLSPSPVVALNRAMAVAQLDGPERGLAEIRAIQGAERFARYPFYAAAVGELEFRCGRLEAARDCFEQALVVARNEGERKFLLRRLTDCGGS